VTDVAPLLDAIRWPDDGLIPVVAQDDRTNDVLMLAFMDREALASTVSSGLVHYRSRSRNARWLKGESSGNVQRLVEARINCDRNSLLLRVVQHGAVCHDGYATCYYRRLTSDGSLETLLEREFDPQSVYAGGPDPDLTMQARQWFGAYEWLRDHDLEAESGTSRRLRAAEDAVSARVADEFEELAGAVTGEHLHGTVRETVLIEATQCLYWVTLAALRAGEPWVAYRPDIALRESATAAEPASPADLAAALRSAAPGWRERGDAVDPSRFRDAVRMIGGTARFAGISAADLLAADLDDLRTRPYLAAWFAEAGQ
jgi:phosphoribosyl-AMP cyclohydrolase